MEFTLREWLMIAGGLVILLVLIDGFRRARASRRGGLKLAIDKRLKVRDDDRVDYFNGELPNGGARVVGQRVAEQRVQEYREPEQESFVGFEEPEPEPLFVDDEDGIKAFDYGDAEPELDDSFDISDEPLPEDVTAEEEYLPELEVEPQAKSQPKPQPKIEPKQKTEQKPASAKATKKPKTDLGRVDEVLVINVFARDNYGFKGNELRKLVEACGMEHGEHSIFHRNEQKDGEGPIQFSMANLVKPGYFVLEEMSSFHTPGVSFFLGLPGPSNSMMAFDYMLETAQCLAKNLNGELRDELHSTLTGQTIEHQRQKIRDFERRKMSSR